VGGLFHEAEVDEDGGPAIPDLLPARSSRLRPLTGVFEFDDGVLPAQPLDDELSRAGASFMAVITLSMRREAACFWFSAVTVLVKARPESALWPKAESTAAPELGIGDRRVLRAGGAADGAD